MHPACEFSDITTYLLAPVQRLPRYLLLVKKLIHYTQKVETAEVTESAPPKRHLPKMGLRKVTKHSNTPTSAPVHPGFPRLDALKRAEQALHGMLLELDDMIGSEMIDFKAGARDTSGLKVTPSYSNNCSDSVDGNSTSNTLDLNSPAINNADLKEGSGEGGNPT